MKKSKAKSTNTLRQMKMETQLPKIGHSKRSSKKEVHSHTCLPQGEKKNPDKQPNLTPKGKEKEKQMKPTIGRRRKQ